MLKDYKKQYEELSKKKNLKGKEALEAVKQDGDALQYVDSKFFEEDEAEDESEEEIITINGFKYKKSYINDFLTIQFLPVINSNKILFFITFLLVLLLRAMEVGRLSLILWPQILSSLP